MEFAVVVLPLIAAAIAGLLQRWIGTRGAATVTTSSMAASALLAALIALDLALGGEARTVRLVTWIDSHGLVAAWSVRIDRLTAVMMVQVTAISAAVHLYATGYMAHDPHRARFMATLSLFTVFMLVLVTADDLLQLYAGWEGIGLCSYLLIGFRTERKRATDAAIKSLIVNRVGDAALLLGLVGLYVLLGTVGLDGVARAAPALAGRTVAFAGVAVDAPTLIGLLLAVGAMAKSAQLGLHTWLPDAMAAPTPVSALVHGATMVAAGVFLLARLSPVFAEAPAVLAAVAVVGAVTAVVGATSALAQTDIKRVLAYSTMSQLGTMMVACGVAAYPAAIVHLVSHGVVKALLFLGVGSVIRAMSDEHDLRLMGGLWRLIPVTYGLMWIGCLALAGVPGLAGFYSRGLISSAAWAAGAPVGAAAYGLGVLTAAVTGLATWRLLLMAFHGAPRANERVMAHVEESPITMTVPLVVLALGAILSGRLLADGLAGPDQAAVWGATLALGPDAPAVSVPAWVVWAPVAAALAGGLAAVGLFGRDTGRGARIAAAVRPLDRALGRCWFFDDLYRTLLVRPVHGVGAWLWRVGDLKLIDAYGPDGAAGAVRRLAAAASRLQSGYLYHYAFAVLVGMVALVAVALIAVW